jgi:hypothetical protein
MKSIWLAWLTRDQTKYEMMDEAAPNLVKVEEKGSEG